MPFISQSQAKHGLNYGLHVLILFVFLFSAFYLFLAKITRDEISDQVSNIINDQTGPLLDEVNSYSSQTIDWNGLNSWAVNLVAKSQGTNPTVDANNKNLFYMAIGIIIGLFVVWVGAAIFFHYYLKLELGIPKIILENIVIFTIVGIFEGYFFMEIVTKYIPITASASAIGGLEAFKKKLNDRIIATYPIPSS